MLTSLKKQRLICILLLFTLITSSSVVIFINYAGTPVFSKSSGFYEDDFYLEISAFNADKIYYTLDGSVPDENSNVYTQPILISNATFNENTNSMRTDTSTSFYTDLVEKYTPPVARYNYAPPDFLIDKCTVIRDIAVSHTGAISEIAYSTFFVGISPDTYSNCNIISIITDPYNLFDKDSGIYVTGSVFENYLQQGIEYSPANTWDANYKMKGKLWEKEATIQIFDNSGSLLLSKNCGVRTQGNSSLGLLPKSLKFFSRIEYDGENQFNIPLFENGYNPHAFILFGGGGQALVQFSDYFMAAMIHDDLNIATMHYKPYVMFLDGEYWGFYWLTEKYDEEYFSYYYNVDANDVIIIKDGLISEGTEEDKALYDDMFSFISSNDMSNPENYKRACSLIDMESLIDYYAAMIYIARIMDWPNGNFALWRTRSTSATTEYSDGKWRWMMLDCNSPCMLGDISFMSDIAEFAESTLGVTSLTEHDTLTYVIEADPFFASLWNSTSFQNSFKARLLYIADECFSVEKNDAFIDDFQEIMTPILSKDWDRFFGSNNNMDYIFSNLMDCFREFFRGRKAAVESWFD